MDCFHFLESNFVFFNPETETITDARGQSSPIIDFMPALQVQPEMLYIIDKIYQCQT